MLIKRDARRNRYRVESTLSQNEAQHGIFAAPASANSAILKNKPALKWPLPEPAEPYANHAQQPNGIKSRNRNDVPAITVNRRLPATVASNGARYQYRAVRTVYQQLVMSSYGIC